MAEVLVDPRLFGALLAGLLVDDPVVRARAADAVEKISEVHPEYLRFYRAKLAGELARCEQKEVRWHVGQMLPRIRWNTREQQQVCDTLTDYLRDSSSIVKASAIQALADLARQTPGFRPSLLRQFQKLRVSGTPAMRARGRKLLTELRGSTRRSASRLRNRSHSSRESSLALLCARYEAERLTDVDMEGFNAAKLSKLSVGFAHRAHETALGAGPVAAGPRSKRQPTDGSRIFCRIRLIQP